MSSESANFIIFFDTLQYERLINTGWKSAALDNSGATARIYGPFRGWESVDVHMTVVQREQSGWYKDETLEPYYLLLNERDVRLRLLLAARFRKAVIYCGPPPTTA